MIEEEARVRRVCEANRRNAERLARMYSPTNAKALRVREQFLRTRALWEARR